MMAPKAASCNFEKPGVGAGNVTSLARKATLVLTAVIFSSLASTREHPGQSVSECFTGNKVHTSKFCAAS